MGIFQDFENTKYPIVDKAPGVWRTVGNFNLTDYGCIAAFTAFAVPVGYFSARQTVMMRPSAITAGLLGVSAGYFFAYQNSSGRLMGLAPNDKEVEANLGHRSN